MNSSESRFDSLFSAVRSNKIDEMSEHSDVQTSKSPDIQTSSSVEASLPALDIQTSKSKNPDFQRTTVYLPKDLHKKFKVTAMNEDKEMSDIMIELIEQWLSPRLDA
jgi:hypothetical protein